MWVPNELVPALRKQPGTVAEPTGGDRHAHCTGRTSVKRSTPKKAFRTAWQDAVRSCPPPEKGVSDYRLTSTERLVALIMSTYGDIDGRNVFPSLDSIARGAAISRRAAIRARDRLTVSGWLGLERKGGSDRFGARITSMYHLAIPEGFTGDTGSPVPHGHRCQTGPRPVTQTTATGDSVSPNKGNQYQGTDKRASADCGDCFGNGWYLGLKDDTAVPCACITRPRLEAVQ